MISYHQPTIFSLLTCQFHVTWKNLLSYFDLDDGECDPKNNDEKHSGEKLLETINLDLDDGEGDKKEDGESKERENDSRNNGELLPPSLKTSEVLQVTLFFEQTRSSQNDSREAPPTFSKDIRVIACD